MYKTSTKEYFLKKKNYNRMILSVLLITSYNLEVDQVY